MKSATVVFSQLTNNQYSGLVAISNNQILNLNESDKICTYLKEGKEQIINYLDMMEFQYP